jgi:BirA family biotin operon repressor/biotin-[acetyl-CoA-carboxylase] ligase
MLGKELIEKYLDTTWAGSEIICKDVTGSTNDDAKDLAAAGADHGTLVVADRQDKGRGSRGRSWETPAGANIAMSLIVRPTAPPDRISMLTLVMGLSVAEGIDIAVKESGGGDSSFAGEPSMIKWPNDVVMGKRKVCGILTELHMNPDSTIRDVVIGVGINVSMEAFPEELREIAGSLLTQTGIRVDRNLVVARCMERFEANYQSFQMGYDLSALREKYEERLINRGERVRVLDPKDGFEGVALGITDLGELRVEADAPAENGEKQIRVIGAGEVSVRGLYSYV